MGTLGLLVGRSSLISRTLRQYAQHNHGRIPIYAFTPWQVDWRRKAVSAWLLAGSLLVRRKAVFPSVVYNCCYGRGEHVLERLANEIGRQRCFNCRNRLDKWQVYLALRDSSLSEHLPETRLLESADSVTLIRVHGSLVVKPRLGSHGQGVHLLTPKPSGSVDIAEHSQAPHTICRDEGALGAWLRRLPTERYLVQQRVRTLGFQGRCFDLRVLVQKGGQGSWGATNVIARIAWSGYFNTSMAEMLLTAEEALSALMPARAARSVMVEVREIGVIAATALEQSIGTLGEVSVDCMLDHNGRLWIIEVNGRPEKDIYGSVRGLADQGAVYRLPLEYAAFLLAKQNRGRED